MDVKSVKLIGLKKVLSSNPEINLVEATFEGYKSCIVFGTETENLEFLNREVDFSTRYEMINGVERECITNFTTKKVVNTIKREGDDFKLYLSKIPTNECNVDFRDIGMNESIPKAIVYCSNVVYESNKDWNWATLTIMDRNFKVEKTRIFTPDTRADIFQGKYLIGDLKRTKFGFKSELVSIEIDKMLPENPLVAISRDFILNAVELDNELKMCIEKSGLLEYIAKYNPENEYIVGYEMVRLASELSICREYVNLTPDLSIKDMTRVIVLSRAYIVTESADKETDINLKNVLFLAQFPALMSDTKVMQILHGSRKNRLEFKVLELLKQAAILFAESNNTYNYEK